MTTLTFNDVNFHPVARNDGQIWLTSTEVALALGYSNSKSISNLYNANQDEFSRDMTTVIEVVTNGINNSKRKIKMRIFSLRGCHLLGFFANTTLAKKFRVWVLNILDKEVGQPVIEPIIEPTLEEATNQKTTKLERTPLRNAVSTLIGKTNLAFDEAYNMVNQYMGVNHIWEIEKADLPKAVAYVHSLTLGMPIKLITNPNRNENVLKVSQLGMSKVRSNYELFKIIERAMTDIDYANRELQKNNATNYSVFESVICQSL